MNPDKPHLYPRSKFIDPENAPEWAACLTFDDYQGWMFWESLPTLKDGRYQSDIGRSCERYG